MPSLEKKEELLLFSLPDDLLLSCVARVSRLYYRTLSLVSKRFRCLINSPELYKVRSLLGRTESCLYVCLDVGPGDYRWFTLCRKPDRQTLTNDSSGYGLAAFPVPYSVPSQYPGLVAVGYKIYNVSGSSRLSILDCQSHTWLEAPALPAKLCSISASLVDQKIYVVGNIVDSDSCSDSKFWDTLVMVFDIKSHSWDPVPIHCSEVQGCSVCIDRKLHLRTSKGEVVAYDSKEGRWDLVEGQMREYMLFNCRVIANVLYSYYNGTFKWYDREIRNWRELKGLVGGLPGFPRCSHASVKLVDYGGKMLLLWTRSFLMDEKLNWCAETKKFPSAMKIWCAVISLEKRNSCEIWGKVEWCDHVLTTYSKSRHISVVVNGPTVNV